MLSVLAISAIGLQAFTRLEVTMPVERDTAESVAKLVSGFAKVVSRNHAYRNFTIQLNGKVTAPAAISRLEPKVKRVRFDDFRHGERQLDRNSRRDVDRHLEDIKAQIAARGETEELEEGLSAYGMIQYRLQRRAYPNDTYDPLAYRKGISVRNSLPTRPQEDSPGGNWTYQGPRNLSNIGGSATTFRVSGRATAVAFSPTSPDTTMFAGTANGGVWKTTNGGASWVPKTDDWPFLQVSDIKIDPTNGNRIYVATGDAHAEESYGLGMMRSTDGGNTWTEIGEDVFDGAFQENILVDPDNPLFVTVAGENGVYRSTNGGDAWSKVSNITVRAFDIECGSPTSTNNRYYYASGLNGQIWRSTNRGGSWTRIFNDSTVGHIRAIACSPYFDDTVYALCDNRTIMKSTDYGLTWSTSLTTNFPHHRDPANQDFKQWSQVDFDYQMVCSQRSTLGGQFDVLYVGMFDLSMYAGNWYEIGGTLTLTQPDPPIHCDHHDQEIHPTNPNKSLVASDGGVYLVTRNSDNSVSVDNLNTSLYNYELWHMSAHPTDTLTMLGGIQHQGTAWSNGPITDWDMANRGDGAYCVISPTSPLKQFTSIQNYSYDAPYATITRTYDGWNSRESVVIDIGNYSPAFIPPLATDPNNGNRIYLGGRQLSRWNDAGVNGGTIDARLGGQVFGDQISAIAVAPTDSNRIYVGCENGEIWRSSDFGGSWTKISNSGLPTAKIENISVSLTNASNISVALGGVAIGDGHIYRCLSTVATTPSWEDRSGTGFQRLPDLPFQTLCRDANTDEWYAGGESGCYWSNDFGATWYNLTAQWGLPNVEVSMLHAPGNGYLYASTFGRGIWKMPLGTATAALSSVTLGSSTALGGTSVSGTVTLNQAAPPIGAVVSLSSNDVNATVPSSVTVASSETTAGFSVTTNPVSADRTVTITALRLGVTRTDTFLLRSPGAIGVSGPSSVVNGLSATYTVTLNAPAPSGGAVVSLTSANSALQVPATMTVPAGQVAGTFTANSTLTTSDTFGNLTASRNSLFGFVSVGVLRYRLASFTISPTGFYSGDAFVGTVTFDRAAPSGGAAVPVAALNGGSVPTTCNIPSGQIVGTFNGSAPLVVTTQSAGYEARLGTNVLTVIRTVRAAELSTVSVTPSSISQGTSGTCRVQLRGKAGLGGLPIRIRVLRPTGFRLTAPNLVTVPAGSDFVEFTISVTGASRTDKAVVFATLDKQTESTTFVMAP